MGNPPTIGFIVFFDNDKKFKPDNTGFNKTGFITKIGTVIYPFKNKLIESPLEVIKKNPYEIFSFSESKEVDKEKISDFFIHNWRNQELFEMGLFKILKENDMRYFDSPIKLPFLDPISETERNDLWKILYQSLVLGDIIATFDSNSFISRMISKIDNGPWSHVAMYSGSGMICEAITSGVTERPLNVYNREHIRIGLYRNSCNFSDKEKMINWMRKEIGKKYNYHGAILTGIRKFLGVKIERGIPPTPNELIIYLDKANLICTV